MCFPSKTVCWEYCRFGILGSNTLTIPALHLSVSWLTGHSWGPVITSWSFISDLTSRFKSSTLIFPDLRAWAVIPYCTKKFYKCGISTRRFGTQFIAERYRAFIIKFFDDKVFILHKRLRCSLIILFCNYLIP